MKINKIDSLLDKNKEPYVKVNYQDKNGKNHNICLNHYNIEYCIRSQIRFDIEKRKVN